MSRRTAPLGRATLCVLTLALSVPARAMGSLPAAPASAPVCRGANGYAAAFGGRRTFFLKPDELVPLKAARAGDPRIAAAYRALIVRAGAALGRRPGSVIDKTVLPPSGDRHDYLSIAPYWWPDPAHPGGPYVRRDGEVNPERETDRYDRTAIGRMGDDVATLGLAYYYSDDARYARKAAQMVRKWFLDPATAMHPNAAFAQAVRGREDGRAEGVLDTSAFLPVIDAVGLIGPSGALTPAERGALEAWFGRYGDWMAASANGRAEQAATNNHGIWFDAQAATYALFARRVEVARRIVDRFVERRLFAQIEPDGRLPAELARTRSLHYSIYALEPAYDVAELGRCLGVDLWNATDAKGRGLRRATDFLAAYRGRIAAWPYREIRPEPAELDALLTRAAWAWGPGSYPRAVGDGPRALEYRSDTMMGR